MSSINDRKLIEVIESLELPESAYEIATKRYEDLGDWFSREGSYLDTHDPHVFVQGSFAFGTAIKPLRDGEDYDLDLSCKLRQNITRNSHSQQALKELVGVELESYRQARGITNELEPMHRCWRLAYQDSLSFHMDVVPCIPSDAKRRGELVGLMEKAGESRAFAMDAADESIWITDDRDPNFGKVDCEWPASNPQGYLKWFLSRMRPVTKGTLDEAMVDQMPVYRRKTPLQRVVQLLKRHRDVMFKDNSDAKPISIIITTLAGRAYVQGQSLSESLSTILNAFTAFKNSNSDFVLNPVNPAENFADRWKRPECAHLNLKRNFYSWIDQANADVAFLLSSLDPQLLSEKAERRFSVYASKEEFSKIVGPSAVIVSASKPIHIDTSSVPAKPWSASSK